MKHTLRQHAQRELAKSWYCDELAFAQNQTVFVISPHCFFEMVTFGNNTVMRLDSSLYEWAQTTFQQVSPEALMDGENLYLIETKLRQFGKKLQGEHVRYLHLMPDAQPQKPKGFQFALYDKEAIHQLYSVPNFNNALSYRRQQESLAIVAHVENQIVAIASADNNLNGLWQIGIDTLKPFRQLGVAAYLVKELAKEIENRGGIPYYTTSSANLASTNTSLKAGFRPAWCGYYAVDR